jgi:spermidine synthase
MAKAWFTEKHTPHAGITLALGGRLFDQKSPYQRVEVVETLEFGRMLLLDGCVMVTDRDEFVYHEMITHPALLAHPRPEAVLIIGGGDGGSVREVLRHRVVRAVHLVEIDQVVIDASRRFFPALAKDLDDPRVQVLVKDGFDHLDHHQGAYDVILVDSMDPVGEAAKLFTSPFFAKVKAALKPGGIAVFQSESPFYHTEVLRQLLAGMKTVFRHVAPYLAAIPTYPSGLWSFTFASDAVDPLVCPLRSEPALAGGLKYFHPDLFRAAFITPNYVRQITPR